MNLQSNDFELFDTPELFAQDLSVLERRWKSLQREAHPDRFATEGPAAQRIAMQWSVRINEAWQRLRDPVRRAAYLCELQGVPVASHGNAAMPPAFLVRQMEWHERIEEADGLPALDALATELAEERQQALAQLAQLLDEQHDVAGAAQQVRVLMFLDRLAQGIADKRDACTNTKDVPTRGQ